MRCLVVEDDPDIRLDLERTLQAAGFSVDAVADGEQAWYQGDVEDYDAAILDLGLPRLDGLSVLRRWRAAGRIFPVIVLSARSDWTEKVEGIEAGADDYLSKPFQMGELVARVRGDRKSGPVLTSRPAQATATHRHPDPPRPPRRPRGRPWSDRCRPIRAAAREPRGLGPTRPARRTRH